MYIWLCPSFLFFKMGKRAEKEQTEDLGQGVEEKKTRKRKEGGMKFLFKKDHSTVKMLERKRLRRRGRRRKRGTRGWKRKKARKRGRLSGDVKQGDEEEEKKARTKEKKEGKKKEKEEEEKRKGGKTRNNTKTDGDVQNHSSQQGCLPI